MNTEIETGGGARRRQNVAVVHAALTEPKSSTERRRIDAITATATRHAPPTIPVMINAFIARIASHTNAGARLISRSRTDDAVYNSSMLLISPT